MLDLVIFCFVEAFALQGNCLVDLALAQGLRACFGCHYAAFPGQLMVAKRKKSTRLLNIVLFWLGAKWRLPGCPSSSAPLDFMAMCDTYTRRSNRAAWCVSYMSQRVEGVRLFSAAESLPAASPNFVQVLIFKWTKALKLKLPSV